jgi:uncharacterized phage infection (PIP) family protein YhgE
MNLDQAVQMLNWLDEEHRKDKAQISDLAGQVTQQYAQIAGLNKSLQDLEERLARVQSQALRYSQIEQAIGQIKTEVQLMLEQSDQRRMQAEEEQYKIRRMEIERLEPILSTLQLQIEALQQFQRSILGDHDMITRVDLTLGTLQSEVEDGIKRSEELNHRLQLLEEWVPRFGQLATEQRQLSERLNKERADAVEAARRAEQVRARHMAEWSEQMKASRREIDEWITQMRMIQEQAKEGRKVLGDVVEVEERLKTLEPRLLQWQRLVEESRRKERDQIVADVEKRWQQQLGEWQFLRDEWSKRMSAIAERAGKLEDWRPEVVGQLHDLVEKLDKERRDREKMSADVIRLLVEMERQRIAQADRSISELLTRVEGERTMTKPKKAAAASSNGG